MKGGLRTAAPVAVALGVAFVTLPLPLAAQDTETGTGAMQGGQVTPPMTMGPGMVMPSMDSANGRKLFAAKGCVLCHAVNGIGGQDASALDISTMADMTNPFDFVANMWRGAEAMIIIQREELGEQVEFTGQELADIIAFLHNEDEQKKFSDSDIPPKIKAMMAHMEEQDGDKKMKDMNINDMNGQSETGN